MRDLAVVLSWVFVALSALVALYMMFVSIVFPVENLSLEERREDDWLALAGPLLLALAVSTRFCVERHPWWAAVSYTAYAILGFLALRFAVTSLSDRSDNTLLVFGLGVGVIGLSAVVASFAQRRPSP